MKLWVCYVQKPDGFQAISAFDTEAAATEALAGYLREAWEEDWDEHFEETFGPTPENTDDLIAKMKEVTDSGRGDTWYVLECELNQPLEFS